MSTATRPTRTYGKRHSTKYASSSKPVSSRAINDGPPPTKPPSVTAPRIKKRRTTSDADEETHEQLSWLQKRRKPSDESDSWEDTGSAAASVIGTPSKTDRKRAIHSPKFRDTSSPVPRATSLASQAGETQLGLPATPKRPKDLSSIFDAITPSSNSRSPSRSNIGSPSTPGKAKKMLGRSRTEGSIEDSPSRKLDSMRKTKSFVETSLTDSETTRTFLGSSVAPLNRTASQMSEISSQSETQSEFRRPSTKAGRTYAGASRSFLVSIPTSVMGTPNGGQDALDGSQNDDDLGSYRASYTELRKRYGIDISSDNPNADGGDGRIDEGLSLYNPLSSITDLRSKGESRRFTDEVGYLLEGLDATAELSVRRSSASDIVQKLCDPAYWRKARAAGLLSKIWELMRSAGAGDGDKVLDFIICCYIALASEDSRDISNLASHDDFIGTILKVLGTYQIQATSSPVKVKMTKIEQLTLDRMRECLSEKEGIVPNGCSPSAPFLLSKALAVEPSLIFANIHGVIHSVSPTLTDISRLLSALQEGLLSTAEKFEKMAQQGSLGHIRNCLVVLDAYLLRARSNIVDFGSSRKEIHSFHPRLASDLLSLVTVVENAVLDNSSDFVKAQFNDCVDLSFRILINLTDGSRAWSEATVSSAVALPAIIRAAATSQAVVMSRSTQKFLSDEDEQRTAKAMDRLCLALALLTNLLQESDTVAFSMQDIRFSADCTRKFGCLNGCQCDSAITSTATIVSMYNNSLNNKDEEELNPDLLFLRGHLALLVALFLLQLKNTESDADETPFHDILTDLSGTTYRRKLDALVKNVEAFSHLYSSVASVSSSISQQVDAEVNMDIEYDTLERDGRSSRASNGTAETQLDVVKEVLLSLRALRDEL